MKEAESRLRDDFGLTTYEARAYVALLRRRMTAKEVSNASGVPMPRVYDTLQRLSTKGFVQQVEDHYVPVDPAVALEMRMRRFAEAFSEERSAREEGRRRVLAELSPLFNRAGTDAREPVLLSGLDSIGGAFIEALKGPGDAIILIRKAMKARAAFMELLKGLTTTHKRIRVALPKGTKLTSEDIEFARQQSIRIRYTEASMLDLMVAGDVHVILGVPTEATDEPFAAMAVWVRNQEFARSVRESLEETWRQGRDAVPKNG